MVKNEYIVFEYTKTEMMVFHSKQKHIKELNIAINGAKIDRVESFNFLGITID